MKNKELMKRILTSAVLLAFGAVLLGVFYIPQKMEERECERFAAPLFEHALPENSYSVQNSSVRDDQGGTTAAMIIGTSLSEEELAAFHGDTEYLPARKGEQVELSVKALDEASLEALRSAGKYREEEDYFFVYIYSSKAN